MPLDDVSQQRLNEFLDSFGGAGRVPTITVDLNDSKIKPLWADKQKLSEDEATVLLAQRLGSDIGDDQKKVLQFILYSLPEVAWTQNLLEQIDVRPFLQAVVDSSDQGVEWGEGRTVSFGGAVAQGPSAKKAAQNALANEAKKAEEISKNTRTSANDQGISFDYTTDSAGLSPDANYVAYQTAQATGDSAATNMADFLEEDRPSSGAKVSRDEVMKAFDISGTTEPLAILQVMENLQSQGAEVPGTVPAMQQVRPSSTGGGGTSVGQQMAIEDAFTYLRNGDLTPTQVRALQERLVKAGYMDRIQAAYVWGDVADPVTNDAFRAMVLDMYRGNTNLDQTLATKAAERAKALPLLSGEYWNATLDAVAQNMIGRNLTSSEQAELTATLYRMRETQQVTPGSRFGVEDTNIQEAIATDFGGEMDMAAQGQAMYQQIQMLKQRFV